MTTIKTFKALRPALNAIGLDCWGFAGPGGYKLGKPGSSNADTVYRCDTLAQLLAAGNQAIRQSI